MLAKLGSAIYEHPKRTLIATGLFLVLSVVFLLRGGHLAAGRIKGLESEVANERAMQVADAPGDTPVVAIFSRPDLAPNNLTALAAIDSALKPLRSDPRVRSVVTPSTGMAALGARMVNPATHTA